MIKDFCPIVSLSEFMTCIVGIEAVAEQFSADEVAINEVRERLDDASRAWLNDLAKAIVAPSANKLEKSVLYSHIVQNIAAAHRIIVQMVDQNVPIAKMISHGLMQSKEAASYYVENRESVSSILRSQPNTRDKLIAHFGDMLVQ